ncbi:shikimate dehydrogenase [Bariatricus massiliensis]|uniref:Shikimate dehydrogenase (NADP(+)) n=1 Tax=Bariatricus massiliensis TaxID=1745713 RepID=A0ABS8DCF4_9FIRM|nr:shikimate dehydrogenase [Bariatricus massiliensis]MCB7303716.1 shikimate dehydrogenase [Bariatricus massiliensis]MCB7373132.1 shikimate dehydrogenase [Bariatricus massiliensis]MCB7385802.1 shikimate dehydrogenase [Bariatricus massiliensis]MCB7409964.1 shikimate dehydrogenase [Bariatricus massiliensis]MCQ5253068.1 shikimate dehydrogenase [Bariatricus massiliensis]
MAYEITGHTVLTGLLGSPVEHSISPMMHNEAFRQLELDYAYLAFNVGTDKLETAVEGLKALGVRGFNLTMPDKNLMCSLADELSPASAIGGAVNTIVNDNGKLTGYTTDGIGFMRSVKEDGHDIIGKKMTLLGAGGAAAAILIQAALDGVAEISVFNIRDEFFKRAEDIIEKLKEKTDCNIRIFDFSDSEVLKREIAGSAILVNGTSVGMAPNTERCIITDDSVFRKDLIVFDVIYNPEETLLLKKAKAAGCPASNGLNMLLYQGAASFELWTGREMPVDIIKEKYFKR